MKEINRERFEAWLFSQPLDREFDYCDITGRCAICSFVRETTQHKHAWGGSDDGVVITGMSDLDSKRVLLPDWLKVSTRGLLLCRPLTIANMQKRYLELFPAASPETEVKNEIPRRTGEDINTTGSHLALSGC